MTVTVNNLLNEDEKSMLCQLMNEQPKQGKQGKRADVVNCQMSSELKNCLVNSNNIALVINHQHYDVIYPIFCDIDEKGQEVIAFDLPEITDKGGIINRYWRVEKAPGIDVFNEKNDRELGEIINISSSGVYIQCTSELLKKVSEKVHIGGLLNLTLRIFNQGDYHVGARVARFDDNGLAVDFNAGSASQFESASGLTLDHVLKTYLLDKSPAYSEL